MLSKYFTTGWFLLIIFLAGCDAQYKSESPVLQANLMVTNTPPHITLGTPISTKVVIFPTLSPTPISTSTVMPTVTATATAEPTANLTTLPKEICSTTYTDPERIPTAFLEGVVAQEVWGEPQNVIIQGKEILSSVFTWNLSDDSLWEVEVSANGQWLAITESGNFNTSGDATQIKVAVVNPNSGESFQMQLPEEWIPLFRLSHFRWLDNHQLFIFSPPEDNSPDMSYFVWSPFSSEEKFFTVKLPGFEHLVSGSAQINPSLDPQLGYIAYPCFYKSTCQDDSMRVLNLISGEIVWTVQNAFSSGLLDTGSWSVDGQMIAVFDTHMGDLTDLLVFNRDGELLLTIPVQGYSNSLGAKWSSNSQYLGFPVSQRKNGALTFSLDYLDLGTETVSSLCINPGDYYWSPDNTRIVFEIVENEETGFVNKGYVINIFTGDTYQWLKTSDSDFLFGWAIPISATP